MADETDLFGPEEWEQHCHDVTRRMLDSMSSFSTPISISLNHDRTGKHLGTGSFHDFAAVEQKAIAIGGNAADETSDLPVGLELAVASGRLHHCFVNVELRSTGMLALRRGEA
jgi:hypothetical protein